jgi:hypothetical protein
MGAKIVSEMLSRRKVFSIIGLSVARPIARSLERRDHLRGLSCTAKRPFNRRESVCVLPVGSTDLSDSQRHARESGFDDNVVRRKSSAWGSAD